MGGLFGGGKQSTNSTPPSAAGALQIQTSVQGRVVTVLYGENRIPPNLIYYNDFVATPVYSQPQSGGGKGGGGAPPAQVTGYTYSAALMMALGEGPFTAVMDDVWIDKDKSTLAALNFSVFLGEAGQAAWGYLTTNHPADADTYPFTALVAAGPYQLGDNPSIGNHSFHAVGFLPYDYGTINGCDPADIVLDMLQNEIHGMALPSNFFADMTQFSNYCVANGFFLSPVYDSQQPMAQQITDLLDVLNVAVFESSGVMKIVPLGDETVTGNGVTFTPNMTPLFDLDDDDYLTTDGDDPVICTRGSPADAYNQLQIEYLDKSADFNVAYVEAKDQDAIEKYGLLPAASVTQHGITSGDVARVLAQLKVQRYVYVRNQYKVKVGWKYCVLEPMDLITLSDSGLGLDRQLVRVLTTDEDDNGDITLTTEQVDVGVAAAAVYQTQSSGGFSPNYNADPGDINTPIIFEPPIELATDSGGPEVWCAVSGVDTSLWGGCQVWLSTDGNTYKQVDVHNGPSRMGFTTSAIGQGFDPDTINHLDIDLSESKGELLSGTQDDADAGHTLCYVDGEMLSYKTAELIGSNQYRLKDYLRRGMYNTQNVAHASGVPFVRLDANIFSVPYTKDQINQTIYIKFVSFNVFGAGTQTLADVTAYPYTIVGPPPPSNVTGFAVRQNGGTVVFGWREVADYALKGYDIGYAPQGTTDWSLFTLLTEADRGTEMTNASVPPGSWTFAIRARDIVDQLSPLMTTQDLVVVNENDTIVVAEQSPDWFGLYV